MNAGNLKRRKGIFSDELGVMVTSMGRLHCLDRPIPKGRRPVILKLIDFSEKKLILHKPKMLNGENISNAEDCSFRVRSIRNQPWANSRVNREQGDGVFLSHDKIKINGETFAWDGETNDKVRIAQPKRTLRERVDSDKYKLEIKI